MATKDSSPLKNVAIKAKKNGLKKESKRIPSVKRLEAVRALVACSYTRPPTIENF